MNMAVDAMRQFRSTEAGELLELLKKRQIMYYEKLEAAIYALIDISQSIEKVYFELVPKILGEPDVSVEELQDRVWDIREEFRHIDYHIHDGELTEL